MNRMFAIVALVAIGLGGVGLYRLFGNRVASAADPVSRPVTDVEYGTAYETTRTFLCVEPSGTVARDWNFVDRWVKPQLTYDTYEVDGRTYNAFRIVNDDPTLWNRHVRFRKVIVNIGSGPRLEGHDYLKTRINGAEATIERELPFIEFNGKLERQRRPLPDCGMPRS